MFKRLLLIFNGLFLGYYCFGQNVTSPVVLASGGGFFSANGYSLSYTYGELSVRTLTKSNFILTEGFQQGKPHKAKSFLPGVYAFPNPVENTPLHIAFCFDDGQSFIVHVFSLTGQLVKECDYENVSNGEIKDISFSGIAKGLYLVKVQSKDGKIMTVFKIERI